jgi:hypothetical protein
MGISLSLVLASTLGKMKWAAHNKHSYEQFLKNLDCGRLKVHRDTLGDDHFSSVFGKFLQDDILHELVSLLFLVGKEGLETLQSLPGAEHSHDHILYSVHLQQKVRTT